jgi:acyl-coenzyme A synthetase/AMP-(fatty) acid ligase
VAGRKYVANCSSSDLAYVIYTSGTTGNPRWWLSINISQFIYNFDDRLKETINLAQSDVKSDKLCVLYFLD